MTDIQYGSFAEVFAAKLAEQGIITDPTALPADPSQCDALVQGDGRHLAGTVFESYVAEWGWETLQPLLEAALANTTGIEWVDGGDGTGDDGAAGADDPDAQASWVYNLLGAASLDGLGLDPYDAPDGVFVAAFVQGDFADPNLWPALAQALDAMDDDQREQSKQALQTALDQIGEPPPSQW